MNWNINWELILKAAGIVVGAIVSLYQISHLLFSSRSTLKSDLEILKLIDPSDPSYSLVKAHIDATVLRVYPTKSDSPSDKDEKFGWGLFFCMVAFTIGFTAWTIHLIRVGSVGWAVSTGVFAVIGGLAVLGFFVDEEKKKQNK
jgi:hypothetical protein